MAVRRWVEYSSSVRAICRCETVLFEIAKLKTVAQSTFTEHQSEILMLVCRYMTVRLTHAQVEVGAAAFMQIELNSLQSTADSRTAKRFSMAEQYSVLMQMLILKTVRLKGMQVQQVGCTSLADEAPYQTVTSISTRLTIRLFGQRICH